MAHTPLSDDLLPSTDGMVSTLQFWQSSFQKNVLLTWLYQWEMLALMQQFGAMPPKDFYDAWSSRFGGGIPLDG